jgi:hypothetical protein
MKSLSCPNGQCSLSGKSAVGHIIRYGFYTTKAGKRRYQCQICGKTFCSTCGTPYYRLQHRRATFDGVASLSVEGVNKSAIARLKLCSQYWVRDMAGRLENVAASYERIPSGQVAAPRSKASLPLRILRSVTPEADFWSDARAASVHDGRLQGRRPPERTSYAASRHE